MEGERWDFSPVFSAPSREFHQKGFISKGLLKGGFLSQKNLSH